GRSLRSLKLPALVATPPATLLERRPDILKAEASLIAADADVSAARAALYPSLDLSLSAGVSGIFSAGASTAASLAASLGQTLFAGGRLQAQARLSEASRDELVEAYAQSVLTGLQEVQDSLNQVDTSARTTSLRSQTVEQANEAYRLALLRYQAGADSLLTLLDSQRSRLDAEDSLVQSELARYTAVTSLFKALGGGWPAPG
ncbi:MAG: TolC family protein, partial [Perlucidibaca sp.]